MSLHSYGKLLVNAAAGLFGARVVNADWGPRGVGETLRRARTRGFVPALVLDVGASNGQWTEECRTIFPDAQYLLVDPLETNREPLARLARSDARIRVFHGVAGASAGTMPFFDHGDQSSILKSQDFPGVPRSVEATTVDALFDGLGRPGPVLFKADVQGYELEVLKGASRCLESAEILVLEVSYQRIYENSALAHEIVGYVGTRGFRIFDICSYLQRASDRDLLQSDLVFVHESSSLFSRHGGC